MLKRTLVFSSPMTLTLRNRQLVMTFKDTPDERQTVPIEDIGVVIIEGQQVVATVPLLTALADDGVAVVLCDKRYMPSAMLLSLNGGNTQGKTLREQIEAPEPLRKRLWQQIVESKIHNQARLLDKAGLDGAQLRPYWQNVRSGDTDNREGTAARLYFRELFGPEFTRDRDAPGLNALLNYGYAILRAATARALVCSGLIPAIGLHHHHRLNTFPLADDVMEPFRPFVDETVYDLTMRGRAEIDKETKAALAGTLYADTRYADLTRPLSVGLSFTTASLARCLARDETRLALPELE